MPTADLKDAGGQIQAYLASVLPRVRSALLAEAAGFLAARNAVRSPIGDAPMDPHPGKMADSWRASGGAPVAADLRDAPSYSPPSGNRLEYIPAVLPGQDAHVTNDARSDRDAYPYSYRMGVLGESPKAPQGTVEPSFQDLQNEWTEVAAAIVKAIAGTGEGA